MTVNEFLEALDGVDVDSIICIKLPDGSLIRVEDVIERILFTGEKAVVLS